jgi:hypothetical protein
MPEQAIESHDICVADVFKSFYVVPDYQREYVWEADQVEQLLSDIHNELAATDAAKAPEYFIGSIVVCPGIGGVQDLIDGQQRMTTLFLSLCAIRDRFGALEKAMPGALESQIAATSTDATGQDKFRFRLDLQYEDSGDVVERIAKREVGLVSGKTRSIANILNAYQVVSSFLRREFGEDDAKLRLFYGYLINKVKLIRIQTEDVAKALKIFETINDRGVGLDAMDLLKNLLFMKAERNEFEKLKKVWKQMQDTIYGMGEKPLRFLRYFIFSRYDVDLLREDEIYTWFARNEQRCGYAAAPLDFAAELLEAARAYECFLDGKDHQGKKNRHLENLQLLGGKAARQHLIMLLAGRHLAEGLFDRLAREVENLFFVYVITREATRDFERSFARWAADLRKVNAETEFQSFWAKTFAPAKASLSVRFDDSMRRLDAGAVQQYRLRYILAKLTQHVDVQGFGETEGTRWLSRYTSNGFEIEHIFPQSPSDEAAAEFGSFTDAAIAGRMGNLLLVEKAINASLGNAAFSKKRNVYVQSQLLLTRAVAERPKVGVNTRIDAAVANIAPFTSWNEAAVAARQEMLRGLARTIWDVPANANA